MIRTTRHSFNWHLAREALLVVVSGLLLFAGIAAWGFALIVIADALEPAIRMLGG